MARLDHFDAKHFVDQIATMSQLTGELMMANLDQVKPKLKFNPTSIFRIPCTDVGCPKNGDVNVPL